MRRSLTKALSVALSFAHTLSLCRSVFLEQFGSRNEAANGGTHEALQVFDVVVVDHCSALFTFAV